MIFVGNWGARFEPYLLARDQLLKRMLNKGIGDLQGTLMTHLQQMETVHFCAQLGFWLVQKRLTDHAAFAGKTNIQT